ncbi:MAG TPA: ubiquinol-cytochrome c reductase iron-sulfur subunit [Pyrinomonadaceae bacterium]|nr:ubiquinol-cytochrome c reductase iron-sulfur subunit [Pyrinomonadaceae bacterium]
MTDSHKPTRRSFLLVVPLGIFATIAGAAFRFLRPRISAATDRWLDVAPVNEITGSQPVGRKVVAEHIAGWAITTEAHNVFVLPARSNQVVSAICPHEGCEVLWEQQRNRFSCPCHESYFAADGARISGPSPRGLDQLPTRVQDGKLQVQYGLSHDEANRA